jgi:thioredoxin-related protein
MQKLKPALFFCLVILCSATFKTGSSEKIQWLKIDDISAKVKEQSKPVLIDLYADWCYWCKVMDKKTYSNSKVIAYINEHFYSAKVNAEMKDNVSWKDKTYKYNSKYQINDFSLFLTYGRASFPTTVIIADEQSAPIPIAGYMEPKELEPILKYFGEGAYKTMNFKEFEKTFKSSW